MNANTGLKVKVVTVVSNPGADSCSRAIRIWLEHCYKYLSVSVNSHKTTSVTTRQRLLIQTIFSQRTTVYLKYQDTGNVNWAMAQDEGMRKPADWMVGIDDRLLEVLRDEGNLTPLAASRDGKVARVDVGRKWASGRFRELYEYGLVDEVDRGLYRITEQGLGYLDESVDARELEPREDSG